MEGISGEEAKAIEGKLAKVVGVKAEKGHLKDAPAPIKDAGDREAQLLKMTYNDIKALASQLGIKAVGKKETLIPQILKAEAKGGKKNENNGEVSKTSDAKQESQPKATKKSDKDTKKKKVAKEESEDDSDGEDNSGVDEEGTEQEDKEEEYGLTDWTMEDLADILAKYGLSTKGKRESLVDRVIENIENGTIPTDDEEDGEEEGSNNEEEGDSDASDDDNTAEEDDDSEDDGYTEDDIKEMTDEELKELAKENEVEIPTRKNKKGKKVLDRAKLEETIISMLDDDSEDDGEDGAEDDGDSEDDGEEYEPSEARLKAEEKVEAEIRKQYKDGKLKSNTIKKFLNNYYKGDPDCKDCKGCNKEEQLDCYIDVKKAFIDDDGDTHKEEDIYARDDKDYCCGQELKKLENGNSVCEICGTEYEA